MAHDARTIMTELTRRDFLARSTSCAAHIALASVTMPHALRAMWANAPLGPIVAREPFGSLESVSDGIWALFSTPLTGDRTTLSNGGIVAGRSGVLAIEGFNMPAGAAWLASRAKELTGRWPTHVALTHYHSDHSNGVAGYERPEARAIVRSTEVTRGLVLEKNLPADAARSDALKDVTFFSGTEPTVIDLGGRTVRVIPRSGHTSSDVSLEIDDPSVVFCGDLVWNAMFPNYVDAIPSQLSRSSRALRRPRSTIYVPGHGALAKEAEFDRYLAMIDEVEHAATRGHEKGVTAAELGADYALPASLGEWTLFNKVFFERAFAAWYRELEKR
jgi:glyoxylase-like metal-dependent hydrolase (beta-lactamase superfamily II)